MGKRNMSLCLAKLYTKNGLPDLTKELGLKLWYFQKLVWKMEKQNDKWSYKNQRPESTTRRPDGGKTHNAIKPNYLCAGVLGSVFDLEYQLLSTVDGDYDLNLVVLSQINMLTDRTYCTCLFCCADRFSFS